MNTRSKTWRFISVVMSVIMVISIFSEIAVTPLRVHAGDSYNIIKAGMENGDVMVKVDGSEVTSAEAGTVVTLKPEADYGYELNFINTFTSDGINPTTTINQINDIIDLVGNNVYYKNGVADPKSSFIKVEHCISDDDEPYDSVSVFFDGEEEDGIQWYQNDHSFELNTENADKGVYEVRYKYRTNRTLMFTIYDNTIISIVVKNYGDYNGLYLLEDDKVELTNTGDSTYTYTQPEKNVYVYADFLECGIILDAGEGLFASGDDGLFSRKRFTVSQLKDSWDIILMNVRREGYTFAGWYDSNNQELTYERLSSMETLSETFEVNAKWIINEYSITIPEFENGTITATDGENNITKAKYGDIVTLNIQPSAEYMLKSGSLNVVKDKNSTRVEVTKVENNSLKYSFSMPSDNVTVNAAFVSTPTITKNVQSGGNVIVKVDGQEATRTSEGKKVTLEVKPDLGYKLKDLSVTKVKGTEDISKISEISKLMGDAEFTCFSNNDFSVKNYNGDLAVLFIGNPRWIINKDNLESLTSPEINQYIATTKVDDVSYRYRWTFTLEEEKITTINFEWIYVQGSNETVTDALEFKGQSSGTITGTTYINIDTSGVNPTFIMPGRNVTVDATFEIKDYTISYVIAGGQKGLNSPDKYTMLSDSTNIPMPTFESGTHVFDGWKVYNYGDAEPNLASLDQSKAVASQIMDYTIKKGSIGNLVFEATYNDVSNKEETEVQTNVNSDVEGVTTPNFNDVATEEVGETSEPVYVREELKIEKADENNTEEVSEDINTEAGTIFKGVDTSAVEVKYINMDITKYQTKSDGTRLPDEAVTDFEGVIEIGIPFAALGYETIPNNFGVIREHGTGANKRIDTFTKISTRITETSQMEDSTYYADTTNKVLYLYSRYFSTYAIAATTEVIHQVTLNVNDGDALAKSVYNVASGETLNLPTPTRTNYTFDGWFTLATGGEKVDSPATITADTTLYAHWTFNGGGGDNPEQVYYTVSFNSNGGSSVSSQSVLSGNKATRPDNPTKIGYTFEDWYSDIELTTEFDFDTIITEDITLYAKWKEDASVSDNTTYTVTFDSNGGSSVSSQTVISGNRAIKPDDPKNGNLVFIGWFIDPSVDNVFNYETSGYNTFDFNTAITENITLKALWSARLTVNISGNGQIDAVGPGEKPEFSDEYPIQSFNTNAIIGLTDTFVIGAKADSGYKFVKWQKKIGEDQFEDYSIKAQITVKVTEPLDLVAVFESTTEEIPTYTEHPTLYLKANVTNKAKNNTSVVKLSWKKVKDVASFEVYGAPANERENIVKVATLKKNKSSYVMKDLEWGKEYVYLVKAIKSDGTVLMESLDVYFVTGTSELSNAKSITAKNIKVRMGDSVQVEPSVISKEKGKNVFGATYTNLYRYFSSNTDIAEVDENGTITAKAVGTVTIFIYAPNGVLKKVTVKCTDPLLVLKASVKENAKKQTSKVTLSWSTTEGANSYNIYAAPYGTALEKIATVNKKSYKITDLEWGKEYGFVVKAVKSDGTEFWESNYVHIVAGSDTQTNAKSIKVSNITLTVGGKNKIAPTLVGQNKNKATITEFTYFSLQPNIATVEADGTVTALAKGKATVYILAPNGVKKSIKITVF